MLGVCVGQGGGVAPLSGSGQAAESVSSRLHSLEMEARWTRDGLAEGARGAPLESGGRAAANRLIVWSRPDMSR